MFQTTPTILNTIRIARQNTIFNSWELIQTAIDLYEKKNYAIACFLSMTAIEELGKPFKLLMVEGNQTEKLNELGYSVKNIEELDFSDLYKFFKNHLDKAVQAAATSLFINSSADRRYGIDPKSKMTRTSGVVLLARSGRWMEIRNNCLYTDVNFSSGSIITPTEAIRPEHAYYFICMSLEILAAQAVVGLGSIFEEMNNDIGVQFWQDRIKDLESFMSHWSNSINLGKLDFLANPTHLYEEAEKREAKK